MDTGNILQGSELGTKYEKKLQKLQKKNHEHELKSLHYGEMIVIKIPTIFLPPKKKKGVRDRELSFMINRMYYQEKLK